MNIEQLRDYCMSKKGVTEGFPFGPDTLVFKVMGKVFLITGMDTPLQMNVKSDPEEAIALREEHPEVQPGYHMNKKHWNTVTVGGNLPDSLVIKMIDDSYALIIAGMNKKEREVLEEIS